MHLKKSIISVNHQAKTINYLSLVRRKTEEENIKETEPKQCGTLTGMTNKRESKMIPYAGYTRH